VNIAYFKTINLFDIFLFLCSLEYKLDCSQILHPCSIHHWLPQIFCFRYLNFKTRILSVWKLRVKWNFASKTPNSTTTALPLRKENTCDCNLCHLVSSFSLHPIFFVLWQFIRYLDIPMHVMDFSLKFSKTSMRWLLK
jgi:hypothetical protein